LPAQHDLADCSSAPDRIYHDDGLSARFRRQPGLARDHVPYRRAQSGQVLRLVSEIPLRASLVARDQLLRPWRAARVAGQDPVWHFSSLSDSPARRQRSVLLAEA
jgi:hypothetical protein